MNYEHIRQGIFLSRPNRFIAHVVIDGREEICHVKNTGRCRELLIPGVKVVLEYHPETSRTQRKTSYDVIGVYKEQAGTCGETLLINMDSQAPNRAAWEWVDSGGLSPLLPDGTKITHLCREVTYGNSRFDLAFCLEHESFGKKQAFMEVKGVTLEEKGVAAFPDAPTQRGVKHLEELAKAAGEGFFCFLLLVIQMKGIREFRPNRETHPEFGRAMITAKKAGVNLLAYDCLVREDSMTIHKPVPVNLEEEAAWPLT